MSYKINRWDRLKLGHLKNAAGMSMIEVLVALAMAGVLSAVIASIVLQMNKAQNQANILNTIETMRMNIQKLVTDGTAWRQTVAHADNSGAGRPLNCIQTNAMCADTADAGQQTTDAFTNAAIDAGIASDLVRLEQASGGSYINTTAANTGYTNQGAPCVGYTAAGNDLCPIRWELKVGRECQGAVANCLNPTIRVVALLYYRSENTEWSAIVNEAKYRLDIRRGAKGDTRGERFSAEYGKSCPGGGCTPASANNGGICNAAGTIIPFDQAPINENNNVTLGGGGALTFQAGTYTCSAASTCFACGTVSLALTQNGAAIFNSNKQLSTMWVQTPVAINQVTFTLNAASVMRVVQYCEHSPGNDVSLAQLGLGIVLPDYNQRTKFAEINCTRIF